MALASVVAQMMRDTCGLTFDEWFDPAQLFGRCKDEQAGEQTCEQCLDWQIEGYEAAAQ